ncbi:hypothetical protein MP638_002288 [Amoeboaphelidium occidentale]|nr:hypothetical protein MP638_002288 [Amoeboaphelidium occidentale]
MTMDFMSIYEHKNKFYLLRVADGVDLDFNMRVDENEMPKTFTTDESLSMSLVEHSGLAVDVGDLGGIGPSAGGRKRKEPEGGKRCKCGSTEHQRISNKNCPLYKPRLKLQYRNTELPEKTVTTTTGFNSVLRNAPLKNIIMDAVAGCTDTQVEVSRLLNGYVIWRIEENRPIPDLRFSDGCWRLGFICAVIYRNLKINPHQHNIVSTPSINEYMDEVYSRCRPDHLAWNDATKLAQLIPNMARMHSSNCQNHVVTNLLKQLRAFLSADDFNEVVTVAMNEITRTEKDEEFYAIPLNIIEAVTPEQLDLIYDRINHYYEKLRIILNNQPLDEDSLKASWWIYLKPMSRLLKTFVNNYEQDAQNRLENGIHGRGLRLFSLTPISTIKQNFILIDTDALHDLMTSENIGIVVPRDKVVFRVNAMEWWRRAFNVDKLTTATKSFGFSISTNGVEYHQHNMKQFERSEINDWGYNYEGEFIPLEINGQTRVVAFDPGRNSLYVAVSGNTAADVLESDRDRHMAITLTTTPCCYNTDDYITHLLHVLEYRDEFLGFYRDMRCRRLRWKTRIKRQKAYDTLYKELAAGAEDVVIAYGGGSVSHNSIGNPLLQTRTCFKS